MYELYPYFTNDGSVGLFSPDADDIYHSTYGALTEAYEKFILPSNLKNFLKNNKEVRVLDICFGIGYNSKSLINEVLNFHYNAQIDTDNIKYIDKLDTYNIKHKIFIHAIDTDKNLINLSPFFITNKKNNKKEKLSFKQDKINRMLSDKTIQNFRLNKEVNILLLQKLNFNIDSESEAVLFDKKYSHYFDKFMLGLYKFYKNGGYKLSSKISLNVFLHNIYYRYISKCYKRALNALKLLDFDFKVSIEDARQAIIKDNNMYNFIFLDAFTPVKCPCLWTVDFFKLLYQHLEENGMILTYSNSALVRNAFLNAGFYVGKIYSESANKFTGTIALKSPLPLGEGDRRAGEGLINELSEYDLGLIKTKAGIFYRDENLTLDNEAIILTHKIEVENSDLLSSSKYIKENKNLKEIL